MSRLAWIRTMLVIVVLGLFVAGVTAFPLPWELTLASQVAHSLGLDGWLPDAVVWLDRVRDAVVESYGAHPFLAYATDWLAFAHLVIAVAFGMAIPDPVRNVLVVRGCLVMCAATIPLILVGGPVRGIPLGWQLIDASFGLIAAVPLTIALVFIGREQRARDALREQHGAPLAEAAGASR